MNERQHYWDNVKGILIILVVVASEVYEQIKSKLAGKEYKGFM